MTGVPLNQKQCRPCEGGIPPIKKSEATVRLKDVPGWEINETGDQIFRLFIMKNFAAAVAFIRAVADLAEKDNHHPDLHLTGYRKLRVELSTHAIGGLSENDFILAAKINTLPCELKK